MAWNPLNLFRTPRATKAKPASSGVNSGGDRQRLPRIVRSRQSQDMGVEAQRRWEAAETNRLNESQWAGANANSINYDLATWLASIRNRCHLEIARNPYVVGVIETHVTDIVGERGPTLQVHSEDKTYNAALEALWAEFWAMPDINGQLGGVDMLRMAVRSCWPNGEFALRKLTTNDRNAGPVRLRLMMIDPRRIESPQAANRDITLGVKRDANGKPLSYFLRPADDGQFPSFSMSYEEVAAKNFILGFEATEPGQARGFPWLGVSLQSQADLRDYDAQILDAARAAADWCPVIYNEAVDATPLALGASADIQRGQLSAMPPGWKPFSLQPNAPGSTYIEYRAARLADLGRPVNMPLMMVTLNSSDHNYSSARFDGQIYQRANVAKQAWINRVLLGPVCRDVAVEGELSGRLGKRPPRVEYVWTWPKQPHVDPAKEAAAETTRMANGTLSLADACAAHGLDWEKVIEQRKREREALLTAGLPLGPSDAVAVASINAANQPEPDNKAKKPADDNADEPAAPADNAAPNRMAAFLNGNGVHR